MATHWGHDAQSTKTMQEEINYYPLNSEPSIEKKKKQPTHKYTTNEFLTLIGDSILLCFLRDVCIRSDAEVTGGLEKPKGNILKKKKQRAKNKKLLPALKPSRTVQDRQKKQPKMLEI